MNHKVALVVNYPLISIVIPTYSRRNDLINLLKSINNSNYPSEKLEILIIDNANEEGLSSAIKTVYPDAKLINPGKNLYSNGARRLGSLASKGDYVFLLDDDNTLEPDCIKELVNYIEDDKKIGMVGPVMLEGSSDI